jgi:predicted transcriptional regulator
MTTNVRKFLMSSKKIGQIDLNTGELIEGYIAVLQPKTKNGFKRHFTMNQEALDIISENLEGSELKVLLKLLKYLDYENLIQIQQKEIATELKMDKSNLHRSIRILVNLGVILKGPKIGKNCSYRLNPKFGWKGTAKNHQKALSDRMKKARMHIVE